MGFNVWSMAVLGTRMTAGDLNRGAIDDSKLH